MINKTLLALKYKRLLIDNCKKYPEYYKQAIFQELNNFGYYYCGTKLPGDLGLGELMKTLRGLHPGIRPLFPEFPRVFRLLKIIKKSGKIKLRGITTEKFINILMKRRKKTLEDIKFLAETKGGVYLIYQKILEEGIKKLPRKERRNILEKINSLDEFPQDKELSNKLISLLHPADYKNIFPKAYEYLSRKIEKPEEGIIGEAKSILKSNKEEFIQKFKSLMNRAFKEGKENQLSELLIGSELPLTGLLQLLKYYEITNSLRVYRLGSKGNNYESGSSINMSESLRFIIISEILQHKGEITLRNKEWFKEISVTSLLNLKNLIQLDKFPKTITSNKNMSLLGYSWEDSDSRSPIYSRKYADEFHLEESKDGVMFFYIPEKDTEAVFIDDNFRYTFTDPGWYVGFIKEGKRLRWVAEKLRKIYHGEMILSRIPAAVVNIIRIIYMKSPELSLYEFLEE